MRWALALLLLVTPLAAAPHAAAHIVVVPGAGDSPENATDLGVAPARVFGRLPDPGGYHYYTVLMRDGDAPRVRLVGGDGAFAAGFPPTLLLVSASLNDSGYRPANLTLPEGHGVVAYAGIRDPPQESDPRYPARWTTHIDRPLEAPATDTYYLVVYSQEGGGAYALLVERPDGTPLLDRYLIVTQRLDVYAWRGEPLALTLTALALSALPALATLAWRWTRGARYRELVKGGAAIASLFHAATAGSMAWETTRAGLDASGAAQAYALAAAGTALAAASLIISTTSGRPTWKHRAALAATGLLGIALWSGALLGPAIAMLTAVLPDDEARRDA